MAMYTANVRISPIQGAASMATGGMKFMPERRAHGSITIVDLKGQRVSRPPLSLSNGQPASLPAAARCDAYGVW